MTNRPLRRRRTRRRDGNWMEMSSLFEVGGSHAREAHSLALFPTFNLAVQRLNRLDGMDGRRVMGHNVPRSGWRVLRGKVIHGVVEFVTSFPFSQAVLPESQNWDSGNNK